MGKRIDPIYGTVQQVPGTTTAQSLEQLSAINLRVYTTAQTPAPAASPVQPQPVQTSPEGMSFGQGHDLEQRDTAVEGSALGQGEANPDMRPRPRASEQAPAEVPDAAPKVSAPQLVFSSDTLMQSVIMSEVLGKPVSLRNRNK